MKLDDWYQLFKEFVITHEVLNTYAVLEEYSDLNAQNFGKTIDDYGKPYFFSRSWAEFSFSPSKLGVTFPAMAVFERNATIHGFDKAQKTLVSLEIAFVKKYSNKKNTQLGEGETRNEIYNEMDNVAKAFYKYMGNVVYTVGGKYTHKDLTTDDIDQAKTNIFKVGMRNDNLTNNSVRFDGGIDRLYGTIVFFNAKVTECINEVVIDPKLYKPSYDKGC